MLVDKPLAAFVDSWNSDTFTPWRSPPNGRPAHGSAYLLLPPASHRPQRRVGHSVNVLLKVNANYIDGNDGQHNVRIAEALGPGEESKPDCAPETFDLCGAVYFVARAALGRSGHSRCARSTTPVMVGGSYMRRVGAAMSLDVCWHLLRSHPSGDATLLRTTNTEPSHDASCTPTPAVSLPETSKPALPSSLLRLTRPGCSRHGWPARPGATIQRSFRRR